jgi:hypothetical protein
VYFKLVIYAEYEQFDLPDIRLPFLESLIFVQFDVEDVPPTRYLGTFIVPALRQLQVPESFIRGDSLRRFVSKSGCQLREVCITGKKTIPKEVWNQDFPTTKLLFNEDLIDWYSMGARDDMFATLKGT